MTDDRFSLVIHWAITEKLGAYYVEEWLTDREYDFEFGPLVTRALAEGLIADRQGMIRDMTRRLLKSNPQH